jgi:NAD(P)-dependent dehydrogenase (short-subunit alcohol dehydrogenase family)
MADRATAYVILGGTGGIGSSLARLLAARGSRLTLAARGGERLEALAREIGADFRTLDATDPEQVEACTREALERYGGLDGIANCVGSILLKPAHVTTPKEWEDTLSLNLGSAFAAVRAAARVMRDGGSVVLVSSAAARTGLPNHEAIAAAKAGIIGLARSAAATYAGRNLRFNAVAPGLVETPLTAKITGSEIAREASRSMHPLGRLGRPEDVASIMAWLLGSEGDWVTGQVFGVDGGLGTVRARPA